MPFLFTNGWMLAGLAALGIPVIIHLLLRRKKKRMRFSSVQFFLRQDEQASQRRKIRNWLLLTLRLLICTLLVLAFARPYLQSGGPAGGLAGKQQLVIVLDRSLSMQADALEGKHWTRAKESVRQQLDALKPTDRAALVACGPKAAVLSEWAPPAAVQKIISDLEPGYAAANLDEGLEQAQRLLAFADPAATTTVCVFSDLQKSGCQALAAHPISQKVTLKAIKVGDLVTPNLAMTDLQLAPPGASLPRVAVANFSDEDSGPKPCELLVDRKVISEFTVSVSAGTSTNVDLALPPLEPGWHDVEVRLRHHDALPADNARFAALFVPKPARTLIVEPRRNKRVFEEESFFVATGLEPGKNSTNRSAPSRFACEKISPEALLNELNRPQQDTAWIVLPGLRQLPSGIGSALKRYVEAGGGLLFLSGESLNPGQYQTELGPLLPCALGAAESAPNPDQGWRMGAYETNTAVFLAFASPNSGDLSIPRFYRRSALTTGGTNSVLATFDDGAPFILARQIGEGRTAFVNTSADTAWNDWPKHKTFVPWLHGIGHYLADGSGQSVSTPSAEMIAGQDPEVDLGKKAARAPFKLVQPDGKALDDQADEDGVLRLATFSRPGVYSLQDDRGTELRRWGVNVPNPESDLSAGGAADFETQVARVPATEPTNLAGLFGAAGSQRELWRVLLMAAVVLLLIETVVGNRTTV